MKNIKLNKTSGVVYWDSLLRDDVNIQVLNDIETCSLEEKKTLFKEYVCIVNLETSAFCNRKCGYCPLSTTPRSNQLRMSDELYKKIVDDLSSINYESTISLNLYNEPLAERGFFNRLVYLRKKCPNSFIKFNSNGDYLSKRKLDSLVSLGVNAIFITLHPEHNEKYIDKSRIKHFNKFFDKLDLDWEFDEKNENISMSVDIDYKGMRLLVETHNWSEIGNDRAGTVTNIRTINSPRNKPCIRPIREFSISYDGSVYPCCQFFSDDISVHSYRIGKLNTSISNDEVNIWDLYASKNMLNWKKGLFSFGYKTGPCSTCRDPDNANLSSKEKREEWIKIST